MANLYIFAYICLAAYHVLDLVCDFRCWSNFEESESIRSALLTATCLCTVIFKMRFFFRCCTTVARIYQPHIGQIDVAAVLSPELNFNVLEVASNLVQSGLGSSILYFNIPLSRNCVSIMHINFTCCCCVGAIFQFILFSRSLFYRQGDEDVNIIGFGLSVLSLLVGLLSLLAAQSC